jgi:hypothetical protein
MTNSILRFPRSGIIAALLAPLAAVTASADVTVTQATNFDLAVVKAHSNKTERISGEKARTDNDMHCEGMMSLLCGNQKNGEITRLDKDLTWELQPDKKSYLEKPFPTAAEIAEAKQKFEKMMEQLKSCPQQPNAPAAPSAPDSSKCDMSPPRYEVNKTSDIITLAGHQAQRTAVTMTQSCKNKETGDTCDLVFSLDTWLTADEIAGTGDIRAFRAEYNKKLGLDEVSGAVSGQMQQFMAPYADALRQVKAKAGDLQGYPLKTTMRVAMGGEHCAQAAQLRQQKDAGGGGSVVGSAGDAAATAAAGTAQGAATGAATEAASHAAGNSLGGSIASSAAGAFGSKLIGGLFAKKPAAQPKPDAASSSGGTAPAAGAPVSLIEITTETTAISADSISGDQFEIPAGWKKLTPKPEKEREMPQCAKEAK